MKGDAMNRPRNPRSGSTALTWLLPHSMNAPARARRLTRKLLHDWGIGDEYICRAEAVVSELVANAVLRAKLDVSITWQVIRDGEQPIIRVEVDDEGLVVKSSDTGRGPGECGRESLLVSALASL
ncbi:ATP-binding protein [Streptomyces sp. NPDC056708]|uniref:ATP-binding protein n=1 Tax=unclassified Streptomyces TaxID=2593676 RepID=UPI0036B0F153